MNSYLIGTIAIMYLFSVYLTTSVQQNLWKESRAEIIKRKREGEQVCLELILVDVSMAIVTILFPVLLIVEYFFCIKLSKK